MPRYGVNRRSYFPTVLSLTSSTTVWLSDLGSRFFGGDLFTISDVCRCPGTFLFLSSSLGRSFHFSGTAPFLKVHRLPPATRNMSSFLKWTLQTTVALVIRKPSFPDFLATPFSQIQRNFSSFAGNVKNLKRFFFPLSHLSNRKTSTLFLDFVSSCLPPSWNTMHLNPIPTGGGAFRPPPPLWQNRDNSYTERAMTFKFSDFS